MEVRNRGIIPYKLALYGELTATRARAHGAVGALVDCGTHDRGMLIAMKFPVFAKYHSPIEAFGSVIMLEYRVAIFVSGELTETIVVNPGDFIFADFK